MPVMFIVVGFVGTVGREVLGLRRYLGRVARCSAVRVASRFAFRLAGSHYVKRRMKSVLSCRYSTSGCGGRRAGVAIALSKGQDPSAENAS